MTSSKIQMGSPTRSSNISFSPDTGTMRIFDDITPEVTMDVSRFIEQFLEYPLGEVTKDGQLMKRRVLIEIMSHGGCLPSALGIYDMLRASIPAFIPIFTVGVGYVESSATILFAAGQKRVALPNCEFTLHEPSIMSRKGATVKELSEQKEYLEEMENRMYTIYQNLTGKSRKQLEKELIDKEVRLTGNEVVTWGLATEVATRADDKHPAPSGKIIVPRR